MDSKKTDVAARRTRACILAMTRLAALALVATFAAASDAAVAAEPRLVVRGDVVHTMAGPSIEDGVVVVDDGRIVAVGRAGEVALPEGARVVSAAVVTPGLVDAHTTVGLSGYLNQPHDQDQLERSEPLQPELRAIDAYNPREALVEWVRSFGVTTVHTGHGPGALVSGQTMIAKTAGGSLDDVVVVPAAMIAATLGDGAVVDDGAPGTRSKAAAMLRSALMGAAEYTRKRERADGDEKRPDRDLRQEALGRVLSGELPLLVTVHRHHDILTALRIAEEFGIRVVIDGASEAYEVVDELLAAEVAVIVHPTMARSAWLGDGAETENLSMETASVLRAAGVPIALQSGFEDYVPKTRVVLFEAGMAAAHGLGFDAALASVTIDAARLIGVDDRVGSLEPGKDADLALYDGDPFEWTTHCVGVVIEGVVVSDAVR